MFTSETPLLPLNLASLPLSLALLTSESLRALSISSPGSSSSSTLTSPFSYVCVQETYPNISYNIQTDKMQILFNTNKDVIRLTPKNCICLIFTFFGINGNSDKFALPITVMTTYLQDDVVFNMRFISVCFQLYHTYKT